MKVLLAILVLVAAGLVLADEPTPAADKADKMDAATQRLWQRHWRAYAKYFIVLDDDYACCPHLNPKYPSSRGVTVEEVLAENSRTYVVRSSNLVREKEVTIPRAEAQAVARPLPDIAVGQYGYLHSVQIKEITGPDRMTVERPWLIDEEALEKEMREARQDLERKADRDQRDEIDREIERRFTQRQKLVDRQQDKGFQRSLLLRGFDTRNLVNGTRWRGPGVGRDQVLHVAVVAVQREEPSQRRSRRTPNRLFVAVPVTAFREGLTEDQFKDLLSRRNLTPAQFVALVQEEKIKDTKEADLRILRKLEKKADHPDPAREP